MGKFSSFRLSINTNKKQLVIMALIVLVFISVPIIVAFIQNPQMIDVGGKFEGIREILLQSGSADTSPLVITIPIVGKQVNLTILKRNPQLIIFGGLGLLVIAMIFGVTLLRNLGRKK